MPGKHITKQQIRLYMNNKNKGQLQQTSAAKAGISVRSAHRIDRGKTGSQAKTRSGRTRKDPLVSVWESELVPLLQQVPGLLPMTLFEWLTDKYPGQYSASIKRTLQRRVKQYKALNGSPKEVMFRQNKQPGQLGLSDFTTLKRVHITINGEPFKHILYHYRLAYSGWSYIKVILGGESFEALSTGLQNAFYLSGGVPIEHRTDSLSAAYNNRHEKQKLTDRYKQLSHYYKFKGSRNNPGKSHENGAIESPHGHFKRRLEQALLLRRGNDFNSVDDYQSFIDQVIAKKNKGVLNLLQQENLMPLPKGRTHDYGEHYMKVTSSSTISIRRVTYSVPSRLIGTRICVHLFDDKLKIYCGHVHTLTIKRVYVTSSKRGRCIDYRHLIDSLVRKPQAFRSFTMRDELLPDQDYKNIWAMIDQRYEAKLACKLIVKLLALACRYDCQDALGRYVLNRMENGQNISIEQCQQRFGFPIKSIPNLQAQQHPLSEYDQLLSKAVGGCL